MSRLVTVFAALGCIFALSSCLQSESPDDDSIDNPSDENATSESSDGEMSFPEALKIKRNLAREARRLEAELAEAEENIESAEFAGAELEAINKYRNELREAKKRATASLDFWREATRNSFIGVQLPEVKTSTGEVYRSVTIREVTDSTLEIGHQDGIATLDIAGLPESLRTNLIHEPTVMPEIP